MTFDEKKLRAALYKSWSLRSARQWTKARPFDGQCNVTAAVVADLYGGDILKTPWNEQTDHYYNRIDGKVYDLTDDQFAEPIHYADDMSSYEEAQVGFSDAEFEALRSSLLANLGEAS
ncbi:MAG: hypothetical protein AAGF28_01470 [Pseudomonadota bacterium]